SLSRSTENPIALRKPRPPRPQKTKPNQSSTAASCGLFFLARVQIATDSVAPFIPPKWPSIFPPSAAGHGQRHLDGHSNSAANVHVLRSWCESWLGNLEMIRIEW